MEVVSVLGLKRRFEEVDSGSPCSTPKDSDDDISSSDSADSCDSLNAPSTTLLSPTSILRQHKPPPGPKRVRFDAVTVYYFSRRQGFTSVPSQGGSSLGMARRHTTIRRYTLGEFAREQESSHRQALRQHLRQEKLDARKRKLTRNGTVACAAADTLTLDDVSDEDLDVEGMEVDDCFFLQPLPTKRRRALLRASGIVRIDAREKAELRAIRLSREECGCDCRSYCDPRRCGCSQAGIKCQVDRLSFPCGCSRDGCGNTAGRIEFNPLRVRTHYLHTIMKLGLEERRLLVPRPGEGAQGAQEPPTSAASTSVDPSPGASVLSDAGLDAGTLGAPTDGLEVDYVAQRDSLALENEAAVLHLQSAEEQERRNREQEQEEGETGEVQCGLGQPGLCLLAEPPQDGEAVEQGAGPFLIQGTFPAGGSLLCFTESQLEAHHQALLKEPSSLVYYQMGHEEPLAFPEEHPGAGGDGESDEGVAQEHKSCQQGLAEKEPAAGSSSGDDVQIDKGQFAYDNESPQKTPAVCQGNSHSAFEGFGDGDPLSSQA
ncbi:cysteine/serine-rich nuclear protein 2 [Paramormyrops kingsleyae]|uniref:cysteine/serine-rich nuclear protein 2 n=1 Tax=Paramormyrops kingsleyae TaxID=1676925 RepID=UPI003B96AF83